MGSIPVETLLTLSLQMELACSPHNFRAAMNYMYMYQGKPHMPPPNTTKPSLQMALHLHVSRTPLVQSPSTPPLMIVRCKFKGTMEPSPHSKTTSPHHYCLTNLQIIHASTLQAVEPPALLQMGLSDPALAAGVPTHAGVNRYDASGDASCHTTSN